MYIPAYEAIGLRHAIDRIVELLSDAEREKRKDDIRRLHELLPYKSPRHRAPWTEERKVLVGVKIKETFARMRDTEVFDVCYVDLPYEPNTITGWNNIIKFTELSESTLRNGFSKGGTIRRRVCGVDIEIIRAPETTLCGVKPSPLNAWPRELKEHVKNTVVL